MQKKTGHTKRRLLSRHSWPGIFMLIAIIGITGFQLYWLQQTYQREKKSLDIKTDFTFREIMLQLQAAKFKLDNAGWTGKDSTGRNIKIVVASNKKDTNLKFPPGRDVISSINVIRTKLKDSTKTGRMIISMSSDVSSVDGEHLPLDFKVQKPVPGEHIIRMLYGVDSLQDSLRITEIDSAFSKALQKEKINIPFRIIKKDSIPVSDEMAFHQVTVGLAHPVTYRLSTGNAFPYLIRRIALPVLFSILLLGITILSFVLLYRNLLKQRRLAELKNEFISNITHELKTPIATVGVAIEALQNFNVTDNPQRTQEYLSISKNELQRLSLLVDKVLKLSMFEKKEMDMKPEPVNLSVIAGEVLASMRLQLEKYHATISKTEEGNTTVEGDRLHLQSVIFNLVDNALKYGGENPAINIDIKDNSSTVTLTISDNGMGIPPEYRSKVFEKFFRVPHGDTHNAKGYGLGLSYVAQVVKKHNGTIELESQPGKGTTFIITLPKASI
ncbi:MAG TPA: HAMP domain-containing sensor histidine kinase [Chitinophagaceae bacterium]|jgi:two-component system phosphate regulon sensor histidine kinase PhoR|nr:HAMP domain-containing sensor histidine kinase [Chitinophagaceae bacterium]HMU58032.1 HAMP domain-containing sensor histidine kinase [Chitinophagaceae bacterium]